MTWEIKSDYEHQLFYRKVLDQLEVIWIQRRKEFLNTAWDDPSVKIKGRWYEQAARNYNLVKKRYDSLRFNNGWPH